MTDEPPIIEVRNLKKYYDQSTSIVDTILRRETSQIQAVDDVSLELGKNEAHGIVGESGCGKTTLLETLMGLNDPTAGKMLYKGEDVAEFSKKEWKEFRRNVQIIFQDPFNALDPRMTVEESLMELLKIHDMEDEKERIYDALERAELNPPERYLQQLPDQLSGGEKQRVSIARALLLDPEVILADEPVSMLDVSTQAAILELLTDLQEELDLSLMYISHDISTVSYICNTIHVMYLGRIVESGPTLEVIDNPKHPYAEALINAIPIPDPFHERPRVKIDGAALEASPGDITGCRFKDRCPERMDICDTEPETVHTGDGHETACHLYYDHEGGRSDDEYSPSTPTEATSDD